MCIKNFVVLFFVLKHAHVCAGQLNVTSGNNISIPCTSSTAYPSWTGPEVVNGKFVQYNNPGSSSFQKNLIPDQKRVRLRWDLDSKSLIIKNVTVSDEGSYVCSNNKTNLFVIVKPSPPTVRQISDVSAGGNVELNCTSSGGKPAAYITWNYRRIERFGDQTTEVDDVTNTSTVISLLKLQVTAEDNGQSVECIVFHPSNTTVVSVGLSVQFPVKNLSTSITGNKKTVATGNRALTLNCTTGSSNPASDIKWFNGSLPIENNEQYINWTGENNGAVRSQNLTLYPTRDMDGAKITCSVSNMENLKSPVNDSVVLDLQFKPLIVTISGNNNIIANGKTQLTLLCTSGISNPVSNITWKINNVITSATKILADQNGDFGGIISKAELSLTPKRDNDGDIISCEAYNNLGTSETSKKTLDLRYGPIIEPMSNITTVEGKKTELWCSASSKPASTFRWFKLGHSSILHQGTGVLNNNKLALVISMVKREDAALYRCNAYNGVESPDDRNVLLTVNYPPLVTVVGSNTSVTAPSAILTCKAEGVPDKSYRYGKWVQTWPGHNVPVSEKPGGETLILTDLTYEHSGVYTCSASNGIRVFGTSQEFIEGSTQIHIKSFPIITKFNEKVTTKLNERLKVEIEYYSNTGESGVKLYKKVNGSRQTVAGFSFSNTNKVIDLPVFTQNIKTTGNVAFLSFTIKSKEDIGYYDIIVSNEVYATTRVLEVIPKGPPSVPYNITVDNIHQATARVSWQQGYHGGFDQTFLIQLSTDRIKWENVKTVFGGKDESEKRKYKVLTDLQHSTTYYVRLYSFNIEGTSPFSLYQNFSTSLITASSVSSPPVGGIVGGLVAALVVIALVVVIVVLVRRKKFTKEGIMFRFQTIFSIVRKQNHQQQTTDLHFEDDTYENSGTSDVNTPKSKQNTINLYEKLQLSPSNDNKKPYDVIKVEKETALSSKAVYENLPKKVCIPDAFKSEITDKLNERKKPRIYENLKPGIKGAKKK